MALCRNYTYGHIGRGAWGKRRGSECPAVFLAGTETPISRPLTRPPYNKVGDPLTSGGIFTVVSLTYWANNYRVLKRV